MRVSSDAVSRRLRVLISAYACEPGRGSEPGVGWNWAIQAAQNHDVVVITRSNQASAIEAARSRGETPASLTFEYVDLPASIRRFKRTGRGMRWYYYLWQFACYRRGRQLNRKFAFDIAHHLTYASSWRVAGIAFLGIPFVWGPVGYVPFPWRLWRCAGWRGLLRELLRALSHLVARYCDPLVRATWRRANVILVTNHDWKYVAPARYHDRMRLAVNAGIDRSVLQKHRERSPGPAGIIMVGSIQASVKGHLLALNALRLCLDLPWRLVIVGSGPDLSLVEHTADRLQLTRRLDLVGSISHTEVLERMKGAEIFLHPAPHDNAPAAVAEAIATGLRVVCLRWGGPSAVARDAAVQVPVQSFRKTYLQLAHALRQMLSNGDDFDDTATKRVAEDLTWEKKQVIVEMAYRDAASSLASFHVP